jgi:hypothetical protein
LALAIVAAAMGWVTAQQPRTPYEEVVVEMLAALHQMTKALTPVTDAATAETARPALKEAVARFVKVRQKAEKLPQPDTAERDRISLAYQRKLKDAVDGLQSQVRRVQALREARSVLKEMAPLEPAKPAPKEKEKPKS